MAGRDDDRPERGLRFDEDLDPDFQRQWLAARDLSWDQVESAFTHGLFGADRFADRPFDEVRDYLRESWEGMGAPAVWRDVEDIVRSGYDLGNAGAPEAGPSTELTPEALERFPSRTAGGSAKAGTMGEQTELGDAERAPEFEGEGGEPVGGHEDAAGGGDVEPRRDRPAPDEER